MTAQGDIEARVIATLDGLGVPYEMLPCDPDFADTARFCEKYGYALESCGNTIIVGSKKEPKQYAACVVGGASRLDVNHKVRELMDNAKLSFAPAEETMALTGMMIGGVTVFALPPDLPIYVDEKLMTLDFVILGSGTRSSKVKAPPEVFRHLANAMIIQGLSLDG